MVSCRHPIACSAPFFPGAGGFNSVDGSGITSFAIPGPQIFGPFHLGSWAQDDERKSDNYYETGRWHRKKAHSRQKEGVGFPGPGTICHGTARSSPSIVPESHEGTSCFPSLEKLLLSRTPFLMRMANTRITMWRGSAMAGRRGWSWSV